MTAIREVGDVMRVALPFGLDRVRNRCPACNRFMDEGPEPECHSCGSAYRIFSGGPDYQVIRIGEV